MVYIWRDKFQPTTKEAGHGCSAVAGGSRWQTTWFALVRGGSPRSDKNRFSAESLQQVHTSGCVLCYNSVITQYAVLHHNTDGREVKIMEESKMIVRSIRADEATLETFKQISEQFPSQAEALKQLVNLYELDAARVAIPGSADMLEAFQGHLDGIQKAFLYALELKQNAETVAKEAVAEKLNTKDRTIADLQQREEAYKAEIERMRVEMASKAEAEANISERVQNAENALRRAESALSDKEDIIAMQKQQISTLEAQKTELDDMRYRMGTLEEDLRMARAEISEEKSAKETAVRDVAELREQIRKLGAEHDHSLQIARKEAEAERRQAVLEAREEAQTKIEGYVAKIENKDEEIARLRAELAELKASLLP